MGKRLIHQRRGRGTPAHRVASHRFKDKIRYRSFDALEKEGSIKGKVVEIGRASCRERVFMMV